ncbi:UNVERIFIED_CONTAM: hypothetical protein PYX00_000655 [Menopon gallinae]|uniref:Uncharacterized protein n=1 Tax=Menopon gallinae TaxID=328185 RepID=A0AAW2I9F8_9NEOP
MDIEWVGRVGCLRVRGECKGYGGCEGRGMMCWRGLWYCAGSKEDSSWGLMDWWKEVAGSAAVVDEASYGREKELVRLGVELRERDTRWRVV